VWGLPVSPPVRTAVPRPHARRPKHGVAAIFRSWIPPPCHRCPPPHVAIKGVHRARGGSLFASSSPCHCTAPLLHSLLLPVSSVCSPSTATVCAPPTPPPLWEGPREPVIGLCPHLPHRRPPVRTATGHLLPPEPTAIANLLWWAPVSSNAFHRSLVDSASPTAAPSPPTHRRLAGIGRRSHAGEGGKASPASAHGPGYFLARWAEFLWMQPEGKLNFILFHLIYSIQISNLNSNL
jgi:hypothetical protein